MKISDHRQTVGWILLKCTNYLSMKIIVLKYTPEDFDNIKPLLPSLASKYVALRYEQAPEHVFQPLAFGNKNIFCLPPVHVTSIKTLNTVTSQ